MIDRLAPFLVEDSDVTQPSSRKFIIDHSELTGRQLRTSPASEETRRDGSHCFYVLFRRSRTSLTPRTRYSATTASAISAKTPKSWPTRTTIAWVVSPTSTTSRTTTTSSTSWTTPFSTPSGLPMRNSCCSKPLKSTPLTTQAWLWQLERDRWLHRYQQAQRGRRGTLHDFFPGKHKLHACTPLFTEDRACYNSARFKRPTRAFRLGRSNQEVPTSCQPHLQQPLHSILP